MVISFEVPIQPLEESLIVVMNIEKYIAVRQSNCCGAANPKMHGKRKNWLTNERGCSNGYPKRINFPEKPIKSIASAKQPRVIIRHARATDALGSKRLTRTIGWPHLIRYKHHVKSAWAINEVNEKPLLYYGEFRPRLQSCNGKPVFCIMLCIAGRSQIGRAEFIPKPSRNRRSIIPQIPAMALDLF